MPNEDAQKAITSLHAMMKEAVSKKEMAQLGASQGKNTSAVTTVLAGGGEPKAMADT